MNYYRNTLLAGAFAVLLTVVLFAITNRWVRSQRDMLAKAQFEAELLSKAKFNAEASSRKEVQDAQVLLAFEKAWDSYRRPVPAKDLGNHLRNALATLATRAGLTAEGTTIPGDPKVYAVGGTSIKVQEVSVTVSSESLPALLTWLGEVESEFPYARVEALSLSSYASHSVQLAVTLYHPIEENSTGAWGRFGSADVAIK
jgi:hypothetical protein